MAESKVTDSRTNLITRDELYRYVSAINNAGTQADPIGTIKAWHKAGLGGIAAPALTDGWVECNGQTLSDSLSIWDGEVIPDLNGDARFLRGGSTSGTEQAEDFLAHTHAPGSLTNFLNHTSGGGGADLGGGSDQFAVNAVTASAGGAETRPINMSVVWIMRVK